MDLARRTAIHDAMVRLADGDRSAMQVLLDQLWPAILVFARGSVAQAVDAEDVAQEVFFRICSRITEFDSARDGASWAFGIASYEIMTQRRRIQRRREVSGDANVCSADASASQEEALAHRELIAALEVAVGKLSEADRVALGLTDERASASGSPAAQRKRRQRALDRLRVIWRHVYGE